MNNEINNFHLSDLLVGQTEKIDIHVSEESINMFAKLSGDFSPLHMNDSFSKTQGFDGRLAHGMLIGAFISNLIGNKLPGRWGIMQSIKINFKKPLIPPEDIQIKGEVTNISNSVAQVTIRISVIDSRESLLATAEVKSIVR